MKDGIHPKIYNDAVVTCVCGNTFTTISTMQTITVDICSACHPFYTGQQKFVDTEGRIDKFKKKQELAQQKKAEAQAFKKSKEERKATNTVKATNNSGQTSLKDMLEQARKQTSSR